MMIIYLIYHHPGKITDLPVITMIIFINHYSRQNDSLPFVLHSLIVILISIIIHNENDYDNFFHQSLFQAKWLATFCTSLLIVIIPVIIMTFLINHCFRQNDSLPFVLHCTCGGIGDPFSIILNKVIIIVIIIFTSSSSSSSSSSSLFLALKQIEVFYRLPIRMSAFQRPHHAKEKVHRENQGSKSKCSGFL